MARVTQPYKNSFSGSVGSGLGSLFRGSGKQYFILEHKINSRFHKAGESQEIIVDRIELGRDAKCQVRFDESFTTVSRRHAAIIREGDKWKLVQLSDTNPTFLNGVTVKKEWYLQNGDEIQLSVGGPKLGFIIPGGNRSTVGTIGLSRRLSLFRQQALRPYKQAIRMMGAALCLLLLAFVGWSYYSWQKQEKLLAKNIELATALDENSKKAEALSGAVDQNKAEMETYRTEAEALANQLVKNNEQSNAYRREMSDMQKRLNEVNSMVSASDRDNASPAGRNRTTVATASAEENVSGRGITSAGDINMYSPYVFAITLEKTVLTYRNGAKKVIDERVPQVIGTGFMMSNGQFVTARHVLEPWYYYEVIKSPHDLIDYNIVANNGGSVVCFFTAISSSGKRFSFSSEHAKINRTTDKVESIRKGHTRVVVRKANVDDTDWAVYPSHETQGFPFNKPLSTNLQIGAELEVLGFPYGRGAESLQITPIYSTCNVAKQGLDINGTIMVSNDNTERGNAGGPVVVKNEGEYQIVGVMSGSTFAKGRIVPISAVL